ncbi:hypothetical protein [Kamptonema formosum]|uniref:hypothetical protein n=1 Tax=Kamptonema formosum TaxID=331992 RepID=UPI000475AC54|nr:hypothetical protein [Oscillatoria sp. PCC 10802]
MTLMISQFQELEREDEGITFATLSAKQRKTPTTPITKVIPRSLSQTSYELGNAGARNYYAHSREIAVYDLLAQPVEHQPNVSPQERLGRFLSASISNSSENLPRLYKKSEAAILPQKRCHGVRVYLDSLKKEARVTGETEFSEKVLDLSWSVWEKLKNLFEARGQCLEVPDACPGSRDNFMYTWSKAEHYLECEIFGTGEIEFFYRNRKNGAVWGEDTTLEQGFSKEIFDKASLFIE